MRARTGPLVYASRMSAKVDSAAVQDGYQLYHQPGGRRVRGSGRQGARGSGSRGGGETES